MSLPPEGIKLITYADNCTLLSSSTNIDEICSKLDNFLPVIHNWFVSNQLEISPETHGNSVPNKMQPRTNIGKSLAEAVVVKTKKLSPLHTKPSVDPKRTMLLRFGHPNLAHQVGMISK